MSFGCKNMKQAESQNVEHTKARDCPKRRRRKRWVLLIAVVLVAAIATALYCVRSHRLNSQLMALSKQGRITLRGELRGPNWYIKLAEKHDLPFFTRWTYFGAGATDENFRIAGRMRTLRELKLGGRELNDASLAHLSGLRNLKFISLNDTPLGDAGLAHLSGLTELRRMDLCCTKVTDAGLAHLGKLKNLEELWLDDTKITDAGLAHLKPLKKLNRLNLRRTPATAEGVADLKSAIPDLQVKWWPPGQ